VVNGVQSMAKEVNWGESTGSEMGVGWYFVAKE
jgi:hypothetical protein